MLSKTTVGVYNDVKYMGSVQNRKGLLLFFLKNQIHCRILSGAIIKALNEFLQRRYKRKRKRVSIHSHFISFQFFYAVISFCVQR